MAAGKDRSSYFVSVARYALRAALRVGQFLFALWATLAIYYSNLPWPPVRLALAAAFAAFSVWALWMTRRQWARLAFAILLLAVIAWEASIPPSRDRVWRPDVAVMPRAFVDGDRVHLTGVRDFSYRSVDDFTVRHIERDVNIAHLTSMDFFISYWLPENGPVAHTFVSFNFDNAAPLAISIEARPEQGEGYSPIASMFKQFELIYIVAEERDVVGVRVTHRPEAVFRYPVHADPDGVRRLFLVYIQRINELADDPEWYSLLKSNCTLNIVRYGRAAGWTSGFDLRHYLNGWVDRYLYGRGLLGTALPFRDLRARARVQEHLQPGEDAAEFSRRIRRPPPD